MKHKLTSYGGRHDSEAEVHDAASLAELRAVLAEKKTALIARGAGMSFDRQAMPSEGAVGPSEQFLSIQDDLLTVSSGMAWGNILAETAPRGLIPQVLVTASGATAGGTLSVNAFSRFSPLVGKQGRHTESFDMLLANGELVHCSRQENPTLFFGTIGGFGCFGIITRLTQRLLRKPAPVSVETRVSLHRSLDMLSEALRPEPGDETVFAALAFHKDDVRVLLTRSRYCQAPRLRPLVVHQPSHALRVPLEWLIHSWPEAGPAFWRFAFDHYLDDAPYIDDLFGYAFFMDGNVRARDWAMRLGRDFLVVQQTFVVPDAPGALVEFLLRTEALFREAEVAVAMYDVMWLPQDEPFALSSTREASGFAVTISVEGAHAKEVTAPLMALSCHVRHRGGRVHLGKNVIASPGDIRPMYATGLAEMLALKKEWDPTHRFRSQFFAHHFPELDAA